MVSHGGLGSVLAALAHGAAAGLRAPRPGTAAQRRRRRAGRAGCTLDPTRGPDEVRRRRRAGAVRHGAAGGRRPDGARASTPSGPPATPRRRSSASSTCHSRRVDAVEPSLFYTGLVAELYAPLRSSGAPDPAPYVRFVARSGEPALELGCGDGDPLLDLRARGLDVEGLDSSPDMLARCRAGRGRAGPRRHAARVADGGDGARRAATARSTWPARPSTSSSTTTRRGERSRGSGRTSSPMARR